MQRGQLANKMANKKQQKTLKTQKAPEPKQQFQTAARGRIFEGYVTKKFPTRVVVEFERTVYVSKYQRFYKKKTRLHARLPHHLNVEVGDYVRVRECRPLSKIIHFIVIEKVKSAETIHNKTAQKNEVVKK